MSTRYFRAGIGTVIFNEEFEVAFFEREKHPKGIWQFQQGGIDLGETTHTALWRELMEEVGLSQNQVEVVYEVPHWISYEDLNASKDASVPRVGQTHQWFFLKLKEDTKIDLHKATDKEFRDWKFVSFEEAIESTAPHKRHVYRTLHEYFKAQVLK